MDRSSPISSGYKLESQIREAHGKVSYSLTCHEKKIQRLINSNDRLKFWQLLLSALTTGSFVAALAKIEDVSQVSGVVGAGLSAILLFLNTYSKNFCLIENAQKHKEASDLLWKIREEYVSLLTDFELLSPEQIMSKRDELQERTAEVYSNYPRTDSKSYKEAQKAIKQEEEQTFSEKEIDDMLPNSLRRSSRES